MDRGCLAGMFFQTLGRPALHQKLRGLICGPGRQNTRQKKKFEITWPDLLPSRRTHPGRNAWHSVICQHPPNPTTSPSTASEVPTPQRPDRPHPHLQWTKSNGAQPEMAQRVWPKPSATWATKSGTARMSKTRPARMPKTGPARMPKTAAQNIPKSDHPGWRKMHPPGCQKLHQKIYQNLIIQDDQKWISQDFKNCIIKYIKIWTSRMSKTASKNISKYDHPGWPKPEPSGVQQLKK